LQRRGSEKMTVTIKHPDLSPWIFNNRTVRPTIMIKLRLREFPCRHYTMYPESLHTELWGNCLVVSSKLS
jgi:hypothetical protein